MNAKTRIFRRSQSKIYFRGTDHTKVYGFNVNGEMRICPDGCIHRYRSNIQTHAKAARPKIKAQWPKVNGYPRIIFTGTSNARRGRSGDARSSGGEDAIARPVSHRNNLAASGGHYLISLNLSCHPVAGRILIVLYMKDTLGIIKCLGIGINRFEINPMGRRYLHNSRCLISAIRVWFNGVHFGN